METPELSDSRPSSPSGHEHLNPLTPIIVRPPSRAPSGPKSLSPASFDTPTCRNPTSTAPQPVSSMTLRSRFLSKVGSPFSFSNQELEQAFRREWVAETGSKGMTWLLVVVGLAAFEMATYAFPSLAQTVAANSTSTPVGGEFQETQQRVGLIMGTALVLATSTLPLLAQQVDATEPHMRGGIVLGIRRGEFMRMRSLQTFRVKSTSSEGSRGAASSTATDLDSTESDSISEECSENADAFKREVQVTSDLPFSQGGYGLIFQAYDKATGEKIAVKRARLTRAKSQFVLAAETEILKRLSHPNIVKCCGSRIQDGMQELYMEYCEGGTLQGALWNGSMGESLVRNCSYQLLEGLNYLHHQGIVHRDVKPSNILFHAGFLKLADFGSSIWLYDKTVGKEFAGTPDYLAPEVRARKPWGRKVDIFSLGNVVLEMLTLRTRYDDPDGNELEVSKFAEYRPLYQLPKHLPVEAKDFLEKATAEHPDGRLTAQELLQHEFVAGVHGRIVLSETHGIGEQIKEESGHAEGLDLEPAPPVSRRQTLSIWRDMLEGRFKDEGLEERFQQYYGQGRYPALVWMLRVENAVRFVFEFSKHRDLWQSDQVLMKVFQASSFGVYLWNLYAFKRKDEDRIKFVLNILAVLVVARVCGTASMGYEYAVKTDTPLGESSLFELYNMMGVFLLAFAAPNISVPVVAYFIVLLERVVVLGLRSHARVNWEDDTLFLQNCCRCLDFFFSTTSAPALAYALSVSLSIQHVGQHRQKFLRDYHRSKCSSAKLGTVNE